MHMYIVYTHLPIAGGYASKNPSGMHLAMSTGGNWFSEFTEMGHGHGKALRWRVSNGRKI